MSLETPNRLRAAAVVLVQNLDDPPNETVEFASNNGFASVAFIDPLDTPLGLVLRMDQPVNNQEGLPSLAGDLSMVPGVSAAIITPNHFQIGIPAIDDLDPFQVALIGVFSIEPVFRLYVSVLAATAVLPGDEAEPVAP